MPVRHAVRVVSILTRCAGNPTMCGDEARGLSMALAVISPKAFQKICGENGSRCKEMWSEINATCTRNPKSVSHLEAMKRNTMVRRRGWECARITIAVCRRCAPCLARGPSNKESGMLAPERRLGPMDPGLAVVLFSVLVQLWASVPSVQAI